MPLPASVPPPPADRRPCPSRRDLKSTILWCSRWLVGDNEFYQGKVHVEITANGEGESVRVKPVRGLDGLASPPAGVLGIGRGEGGEEAVAGVEKSELLRVLFSRDEERILDALVGHEPSKAADVLDRCKVEKSKFWVLWSNLQQRGVVGDAERGDGFVVLLGWVRELVERKRGGAGRGA